MIFIASLKSSVAGETVYVLPLDTTTQFGSLFAYLKLKSSDLGIGHFGVTITSLEQVFVSLAKERKAGMLEGGMVEEVLEPPGLFYSMYRAILRSLVSKEASALSTNDSQVELELTSAAGDEGDAEVVDLEAIRCDAEFAPPTDMQRVGIQLYELLRKRYVIARRDLKGIFFQIIFPGRNRLYCIVLYCMPNGSILLT